MLFSHPRWDLWVILTPKSRIFHHLQYDSSKLQDFVMLSDKSFWPPQGAPVYTCHFGGATT